MALTFYHTSNNNGGAITGAVLGYWNGAVLPDIPLEYAATGITNYACICMKNTGASVIVNAGVFFASSVQNAKVYLAMGLTGKNSTTEQIIANNMTPPVGNFVYQRPFFSYAPLIVGTLNPGDFYHLWLKRVISVNATGESNAYFILTGTES
jgi:hypothetical protein